jgi:hypothetical protein
MSNEMKEHTTADYSRFLTEFAEEGFRKMKKERQGQYVISTPFLFNLSFPPAVYMA